MLMPTGGLQTAPLQPNLEAARNLIAERAAQDAASAAAAASGSKAQPAAPPLTDREQRLLRVRETGRPAQAVAPAENSVPLPLFRNANAEKAAFPTLFPYGRGTAKDEREVAISTCKYIRNRLMHADLRFATHRAYLFWLVQLYDSERVAKSSPVSASPRACAMHLLRAAARPACSPTRPAR